MRTFQITTFAPCPPATLYDLSLDVEVHVASMSASGERAVAGVTRGAIRLGEQVTWSARHLGVRWRMTVQITAAERPARFVDEQIRGPFRTFRHEHRFQQTPDGTLMTDRITVASPVLGFLVEPLVLVPVLRRLLVARNAHLLRQIQRSTDAA